MLHSKLAGTFCCIISIWPFINAILLANITKYSYRIFQNKNIESPLHSSNIQNAALLGLICIYIFTKSMLTIYLFVKYILSYVTEVKVILSIRSCVTNEFLENFNFVSHQFQFVIVEDSLKFPSRNKLCTFTHSLQPALNFFQLDLSVSSIFYQFLLPLVNFICTNKQLANVNITSLLSKKYAFPHSGGFY